MRDKSRAQVLANLGDFVTASSDELFSLLYEELHALAVRYMRGEKPGHTLQPTALVSEAYLRLGKRTDMRWESRSHFVAVAACCIRRVLLEHARRRRAAKRGGGQARITLSEDLLSIGAREEIDIIALDEALDDLAARDRRQAGIVELRFFGGLTIDEIANVLQMTAARVKNEWQFAKFWLRDRLEGRAS